jgi:hypothetical protein
VAIGAFLGALLVAYGRGRSDANTARQARDAKDYRNERQKIDAEISGIGSTDSERIDRLRDIERKRAGKN